MVAYISTPWGPIWCRSVFDGLAVDPIHPPRSCDPMRRVEGELLIWMRRPYIVTTDAEAQVWCLKSGMYDVGMWGAAASIHDAAEIALALPVFDPRPEIDPDDDPELNF